MKAPTSIALAAGLAICLSAAANADPVREGTTTNPTGINGLVVDGTIYNVTFSTTTLNSFTLGTTLSKDAGSALAAALNTLLVTELANIADENDLLDVDSVVITAGLLTEWGGASCTACSFVGSRHWFAGAVAEGYR